MCSLSNVDLLTVQVLCVIAHCGNIMTKFNDSVTIFKAGRQGVCHWVPSDLLASRQTYVVCIYVGNKVKNNLHFNYKLQFTKLMNSFKFCFLTEYVIIVMYQILILIYYIQCV